MRLRLVAIAVTTMVLGGCRSAAPRNAAGVRIAIAGRAALDFIPVYLASALGFFRDEGLQVTFDDLSGGAKVVQALLGGSSDVAAGGYDATIEMALQGKPIQAIAMIERWPPLAVAVAQRSPGGVQTISDLKGRVVGVSSPGSSTHRFLNYLLIKNGVPLSEVTTVGVGVNFSMAAAVQGGRVDAAVAGPLGMSLLTKNRGIITLADCRTAEGARQAFGTADLPFVALLARPEWLRAHGDTARRLVRATRRALTWVHEHSAQEVSDAMPRDYKGDDQGLYLTAVRDILPVFSVDGLMPRDGPANVKAFLALSDPRFRAAEVDLSRTYTNEFVEAK